MDIVEGSIDRARELDLGPGDAMVIHRVLGRAPQGFDEHAATHVTSMLIHESMHHTIQRLVVLASQLGVGIDNLKQFITQHEGIEYSFRNDICDIMREHFPRPEKFPATVSSAVIEKSVREVLHFFAKSLKDGSLFDYMKAFADSLSREEKTQYSALLNSQRFQAVLYFTFRDFVAIVVDNLFTERISQPEHRADYFGYFGTRILRQEKKKTSPAETQKLWKKLFVDGLQHGVSRDDLFAMAASTRASQVLNTVRDTRESADAATGIGLASDADFQACMAEAEQEIHDQMRDDEHLINTFSNMNQSRAVHALNPFQHLAMMLRIAHGSDRAMSSNRVFTDIFFREISPSDLVSIFYHSTDSHPRPAMPVQIVEHDE